MLRYAVYAADAAPDYSFCAPIVAALWRQHGFTPLVFQIGEWTGRAAICSDALRAVGATVVPFPVLGIWPAEWYAKCIRLVACAAPGINADDYLLTADADMAVLDPAFIATGRVQSPFHIFYANAYLSQRGVYPICYLGGKAEVWRILAHPTGGNFDECVRNFLRRWSDVGLSRKTFFDDELILRALLFNWSGYPKSCQFLGREQVMDGYPTRRIQRDGKEVERPIDFHLPRPAYSDQNWPLVERWVLPKLDDERQRQLRAYRADYIK